MKNLLLGIAGGLGLGAGGCYLYFRFTDKLAQPSVFETHPVFKYGAPEDHLLRVHERFVASYEYKTRNSKWVIEKFSSADLQNDSVDRSKSTFFEDSGIEARFRAKLNDYKGSGFDRGHLAPAANHKSSQDGMDETFSLSNMSPQIGRGFNRDYWSRFEQFIRKASSKGSNVYVVTGPLWLPTPDAHGKWVTHSMHIGEPPAMISVPTHFFKVVLVEGQTDLSQALPAAEKLQDSVSKAAAAASTAHSTLASAAAGGGGGGGGGAANGKDVISAATSAYSAASAAAGAAAAVAKSVAPAHAIGAFVMPNMEIDSSTPLAAFVVPLEALEAVAGLKFFGKYITDERRKALDAAAIGWRVHGLMQIAKANDRKMLTQRQAAIHLPDVAAAAAPPPTTTWGRGGKDGKGQHHSHHDDQHIALIPKTTEKSGVIHLCEYAGCNLPKAFAAAAIAGNGSGSGGESSDEDYD